MESERLVYPRITKSYAKSLIQMERYVVDEEMCVVLYLVKLVNDHRVIGEAIVANSDTFDPEKGKQIARDKVINKIIDNEMYNMRSALHEMKSKEVGHDH